jgi:4-diphosphocytidyl-2-C-methyl-D-erythritol kinase
LIYFPNAKINLGLKVLGRREDGFHEVRSLFLPVGWCDVLEVHVFEKGTPGKMTFSSDGLEIKGKEENNLVVKAHALLSADYKLPEIKACLLKVIPTEAGLGGGSSDASFMLKALNEVCDLELTSTQLKFYAAMLGSDCPFFIDNKPTLIEGRGEILSTPEFSLGLDDVEVLIVHPGVGMNTAKAFGLLDISTETSDASCNYKHLISTPLDELKDILINDFEKPVNEHCPEVGKVLEFLKFSGASYTQMTGSGTAVFGLYEKGKCDGLKLKSQAEDLGYTAHFGALL